MGSSQSLESKDSDATFHQRYNRCVSETLFDISERKKSFEIVAMNHVEKPTKLYFVLLGDRSFGFCLSIDTDENGNARPSFDYELDYHDPRYILSFVTNGTLKQFVEIMNLTSHNGDTNFYDPDFYAKNLFRIDGWEILESNQDHVKRIQQFFELRGVENAEIVSSSHLIR